MDSSQIEYYDAIVDLDGLGVLLCGLIRELLADADIQVHSVSSRVKDFESTTRKLNLKTDKYSAASDLTDLLGGRVITYFAEDVDRVAEVIKSEFNIDKLNSVDKRKILDADQFGYLSLHFVASMSSRRSKLTEYKRYEHKKFELQIRSILQHAWAEIEHDLGYKAKSGLPQNLKRRFSRLAGSLELADEEFERLRKDISDYEVEVDIAIKKSPQTLPINQSTLVASLENEKPLNVLDELVAKAGKVSLGKNIDPSYVVKEGENLVILGVNNIDQLHDLATRYSEHIRLFSEIWLNGPGRSKSRTSFSRGVGLFYLNYVLAAQKDDQDLENWGLQITTRNKGLIKEVKDTWQLVISELGVPGH